MNDTVNAVEAEVVAKAEEVKTEVVAKVEEVKTDVVSETAKVKTAILAQEASFKAQLDQVKKDIASLQQQFENKKALGLKLEGAIESVALALQNFAK